MQIPAPQALPEERFAIPTQATAPAEAVQSVAAEMPVAVVAAEPVFAPEPAAAPPAVHAESVPAPVAVRSAPIPAPAPAIDLAKALQESGLVMIQTDPNKAKPAEPVAESEFVPSQPRPRRAPPPDTGPLQIVETRKDA